METRESDLSTGVLPCFRERPAQRIVTQEGYPYIALGLAATFLSALVWGFWGALLPLLITLYIVSFFRNPDRKIPEGEGLIIAPADGKILEIADCREDRYLNAHAKRVSIFMSPLNCHINRAPVTGKVVDCFYQTGTFAAAFKPKAMERNEHHAVLLEDAKGRRWLVVQIAGWLARRIVSYVQEGFSLKQGERFGLIQFGSRADLYCPVDAQIFVKPGQKVYGGKTILGRIS
ncbi:MAG: phosphatidylserine decarboxylase family protein [Deltaproteobacteria bacterium]|nr:phosphatidylserine decarboxylase family protein [Deltaproteobacteria bacterium]